MSFIPLHYTMLAPNKTILSYIWTNWCIPTTHTQKQTLNFSVSLWLSILKYCCLSKNNLGRSIEIQIYKYNITNILKQQNLGWINQGVSIDGIWLLPTECYCFHCSLTLQPKMLPKYCFWGTWDSPRSYISGEAFDLKREEKTTKYQFMNQNNFPSMEMDRHW